mgnify:CR=1 FL=1
MARNGRMVPSKKAKDIKVAFWGKNNTIKSDLQSGGEAIDRYKKGRPTNKSTDEFIEELKKRGEW